MAGTHPRIEFGDGHNLTTDRNYVRRQRQTALHRSISDFGAAFLQSQMAGPALDRQAEAPVRLSTASATESKWRLWPISGCTTIPLVERQRIHRLSGLSLV
jgi:hypothetical protein